MKKTPAQIDAEIEAELAQPKMIKGECSRCSGGTDDENANS